MVKEHIRRKQMKEHNRVPERAHLYTTNTNMVRQSPGVKHVLIVDVLQSPLSFKSAKAGASVGGDMRASVGDDMRSSVGGDMRASVGGDMRAQAQDGVDTHAQGADMRCEVDKDQDFPDADVATPMPKAVHVDLDDKADSSSQDDGSSSSESEVM